MLFFGFFVGLVLPDEPEDELWALVPPFGFFVFPFGACCVLSVVCWPSTFFGFFVWPAVAPACWTTGQAPSVSPCRW